MYLGRISSCLFICFRELPTTSGLNPIPQPRSTTHSSSSREEKNGYEVAPGLDHILEEKHYKGRLSLGYNDDILESRYGGRISPPSRQSPLEYQNTDSGYPSTSPVSDNLLTSRITIFFLSVKFYQQLTSVGKVPVRLVGP